MKKINFYVGLLILFLFCTCQHEPLIISNAVTQDLTGTPCNKDTVYFQNQILPLLVSQCGMSDCHNTQYHTVNIDLTNYENVAKLIVPGHSESSVLFLTINNPEPTDRMPIYPLSAWNDQQINLLKKWIDQGALNNSCNENYGICDTLNISYSNFIEPLLANHCQGCHIQDSWGGGIILNSYEQVKTVAQNGKLLGSIMRLPGYFQMPKFGIKLTECNVKKVNAWIHAGMPM